MTVSVETGRATATQYRLVFPMLPTETTLTATDEMVLNIFSVNVPSVSLNQSEQYWQGKHMDLHTGGLVFDPLNISFMVDAEFKNWNVLFNWLTYVSDNYEIPSAQPKDYMVDASLLLMDNWNDKVLTLMFKNMWIQSLGELSLSIRDGESHIESSATFYYDRYEVV